MSPDLPSPSSASAGTERQITTAGQGHMLTNIHCWSRDSRRIVYDIRSDPAGSIFDGTRIETIDVRTGEVHLIYESKHGACCGVATFSPADDRVAFILGPEHPTSDWTYSAWHRQGVIVNESAPGIAIPLDARDLSPPFTAGALRGGTHVHIFNHDGRCVSFTYEDHVLAALHSNTATENPSKLCDINQRNIGISVDIGAVCVPRSHVRNHDGSHFSVLVTTTHRAPRPGSDEIQRAFEEAWIGDDGYQKPDGTVQRWALAFQGEVITSCGDAIREVFIVDVPDDIKQPGTAPLQGTATTRPAPPRGTNQRRLTFTAQRKFPGIQGPRHWLRSAPDGSRIACLMRDDDGVVQIFTIAPTGGPLRQLTHNPWPIESAFSWSPDGSTIACVIDRSIFTIDSHTGHATRHTERSDEATAPRPEACVFSPDGRSIAFMRNIATFGISRNQIFILQLPSPGT